MKYKWIWIFCFVFGKGKFTGDFGFGLYPNKEEKVFEFICSPKYLNKFYIWIKDVGAYEHEF